MTLVAQHELDVDHLVADDRVHRLVYLDPAVFEAEMARIFARTWVYVGHDSEVPEPGDFKTTTLGRQPVALVRQADGTFAVLMNRCPHRAATVCQERRGTTKFLRCPYHGWTFRLDGSLIGATYSDGYGDDDLDGPEFVHGPGRPGRQLPGLRVRLAGGRRARPSGSTSATPRTTSTCSSTSPPAAASSSASPASTTTATTGTGSCSRRTASTATTPTSCTAPTSMGSCPTAGAWPCSPRPRRARPPIWATAMRCSTSARSWATATSDRPSATPAGRAHLEALVDRLGEARAREVVRTNGGLGFNLLVFPNLLIIQVQIRVVQPRRVDWTEVELYPTLLEGATEAMNARRLRIARGVLRAVGRWRARRPGHVPPGAGGAAGRLDGVAVAAPRPAAHHGRTRRRARSATSPTSTPSAASTAAGGRRWHG